MNKTWIYSIGIVAVLLVAAAVYFSTQHSSTAKFESPGLNPSAQNVFEGKITSGNTEAQTYTNVPVLTDEGCTTDQKTGLANCTTKLETDGGVIAFNYEHDMMQKPCLSLGDKAIVQVNGDGSALVERTYWAGGGA